MIDISLDEQNVKLAETFLADAPKEVQRAASAAINRTITKVKTATSVTVRKRYVANAGAIKKSLSHTRATASKPQGRLRSEGPSLPLTAFQMSRAGAASVRGTGPMRVKVLKSSSPKPVRGLFSRTFPRGYFGPMMRVGRTPYPLRTPAGPSVPQMVGHDETMNVLVPEAEKTLNERFLHEVEFRMGRIR